MARIGMIFRIDGDAGTGEIMFAEGEKRSFSMNEWADGVHTPSLGQKVSYEQDSSGVKISVASIDADITMAPQDPTKSTSQAGGSAIEGFTSIDDYINYFTDLGFNRAKDIQVGIERTVSFRKLHMGDPIEIIIKQRGTEITATQTVNGKVTPLG
jgi:hypothetical protein